MDIILDTNFLVTCAKQKIDLFEQIKDLLGNVKFIVPEQVVAELESLSEDKKLKIKEREAAKLSVDLIKNNFVIIIDLKVKNTDAGIVKYANENNIYIATLDRELKNKIKNPRVRFLTIRQKKRIAEI
jgi:rRNA-processing protein FCF1